MNKSIQVEENVALAPFTTLKIGGNARFFVKAETEAQIVEAVNFAAENDFDLFILGGGSNVLIADDGFDGLVLQVALRGIAFGVEADGILEVKAQAGEDWDDFVKICVEKNLQGLECLSGIPGFVGGTPVQNVGAYGQEVSETISTVRVFDRRSGEILELSNDDCKFSYRASIFNQSEKNRFIVLAVTFRLKPNGEPKVVYKDLREFFKRKTPDLQSVRKAVLKIRRAKSMVINKRDVNSKSVGSFFKNPVVSTAVYEKIKEIAECEVPFFQFGENSVKIPAAWLIENSGFCKGFRKGAVGLSENHTLAIVNYENGSAKDVINFKNLIQENVRRKFDIELAPEPVFVGY